MKVSDFLQHPDHTLFSFEILPPMKGNSIDQVWRIIDKLREFDPKYINITSHHSEWVYVDQGDGTYQRKHIKRRPGSVAVAAAIQSKYGITAVPHLICSGFSREETEYALIDLQFLGIENLLLLRGDIKNLDPSQHKDSNRHATDLQAQVNDFNAGRYYDGTAFTAPATPFSYGMACYPEKHEEAPNMDIDIAYAKAKVDAGAEYLVTQMFFDNQKYYDFCARCRAAGITVPIVPGIKPLVLKSQMTVLPRIFRTDLPEDLAAALRQCKDDNDVKAVGVEWATAQCRDLIAHHVGSIHFYTLLASESVRQIAQAIY